MILPAIAPPVLGGAPSSLSSAEPWNQLGIQLAQTGEKVEGRVAVFLEQLSAAEHRLLERISLVEQELGEHMEQCAAERVAVEELLQRREGAATLSVRELRQALDSVSSE